MLTIGKLLSQVIVIAIDNVGRFANKKRLSNLFIKKHTSVFSFLLTEAFSCEAK